MNYAFPEGRRVWPDQADEAHTKDELYEHRHALFAALARSNPGLAWRSKLHDDGTMFEPSGQAPEGWFIAGMRLPTGDISYHLPLRYWDAFSPVDELDKAPKWDGYTSDDVVNRLNRWLLQWDSPFSDPKLDLQAALRMVAEGHARESIAMAARLRDMFDRVADGNAQREGSKP